MLLKKILLLTLLGLSLAACASERHVVTTPVPPAPTRN